MGENLLALSAPTPRTATQVAESVSEIRNLVSVNAKGTKSYLNGAIARLKDMKRDSEDREEKAYDLLGVGNLKELQDRLDDANREGLWLLTNKALNKMPLIQNIKNSSVSIETVRNEITSAFNDFLKGKYGSDFIDELSEDMLMQAFRDFEKELDFKRGTVVEGIKFSKNQKKQKGVALIFNDSLKKRKSRFVKELKIDSQVNFSNLEYKEGIIFSFEDRSAKALNSYPYFKLKSREPEEAKEIKESEDIWRAFIQMVSSCVGGSMEPWVRSAMITMGKESFISTGESYGDIVGILGELQAMAFLLYLGASKSVFPKFLAHATTDKKAKIGTDIVLDNIGFQIKNYNTYGSPEQGNEGFQTSSKYTLNNFLDIISAAPHIAPLREKIQEFYAISAYHIAMHEDFNNIRSWIDHVQNDQLPNLYHSAISELLPVKQIEWINEQTQENGVATNAFYLVGGRRILPVSKILGLYIKFLEKLQQNEQQTKLISMNRKTGGIKYDGTETYKDYYEQKEGYFFSGYKNIANDISIYYRININIDYSLEEVLSKALKE